MAKQVHPYNGFFSSVQSLSCVRLFVTPWITARQASLSITNSRSSLRLTSIKSVMPSSHFILCHPLLLLFLLMTNNNGLLVINKNKLIKQHAAAAAAKSLQSCLTLWYPIDSSPPGSPVPGILQARTLEGVAISFSNGWKWKVKVKSLSHVWHFATPWTATYQAPLPMGFSRQEYWSGLLLPSLKTTWTSFKCTMLRESPLIFTPITQQSGQGKL